jgi:hypothetical protein
MKILRIVYIASFLIAFIIEMQATIRYVRPTSYGSGNGTSWANASNDLQLMINNSAAGDTVWVAAGTYLPKYTADGYNAATQNYPYTDGGRDNAFVLKENVQIYGGFAGTETNLSQRNWNANATILSGQRGNNPNSTTNNCYHVVISAGEMGTACLDGFTITKGRTRDLDIIHIINIMVNGYEVNIEYGGGLHNTNSSPTLTHLNIDNNWAWIGGGIYNNNSSPILTDVIIAKNTAHYGGGMYNDNHSFVLLTEAIITENTGFTNGSGFGGGIYNNNSSIELINVIITKNYSDAGGGICNRTSSSSAVLTNVIIAKNICAFATGAGIYNGGKLVLTNITISNNHIIDSTTGGDVNGG